MKRKISDKLHLDSKDIKELFRFENAKGLKEYNAEDIVFDLSETIPLKFEDLLAAVKNIEKSELSTDDIYTAWYSNVNELLNMDDAFPFSVEECKESDNSFIPSDFSVFWDIFGDIEEALLDGYDEIAWNHFSEDIEKAIRNRGKKAIDKEYTEGLKDFYISLFDNDNRMNSASESEIALLHRFIKERLEKDSHEALYAVAYGCYGGNRAFECDWKRSEEALLKLISIGDNSPFLANTLGYIYYYGRINNQVPEYDKAFKYFAIGAAGGVYESRYKLADMFRHGYFVPKNADIETQIIDELYTENLGYIANGNFRCKFADIALRKARILLDRIKEFEYYPKEEAYYFLLQADFAIKRRMECTNYYGDASVCEGIKKSICEFESENQEIFTGKTATYYSLRHLFEPSLTNGRKMRADIKKLAGGKYSVKFSLVKRDNEKYAPKMFITIPEIKYCGMRSSLTVKFTPYDDCPFTQEDGSYIFDSISDYGEICDYGKALACFSGVFKIKLSENDNQKTYRIASVSYGSSEKLYDFICDDESITEGEYVLAGDPDAPDKVLVVKISDKKESELALPMKVYKKILRRAE